MEGEDGTRRKTVRRPMDKFKGSIRGPLRFRASVPKKHQEGNRTLYPTITLNNREMNKTKDFPENAFFTTKYTLWSFLPKVLWEQFRKATSFYFLIICIITLIPKISPISPLTSISGLLFILIVSAIREAYEDYGRLTADTQVNTKRYTTLEEGTGAFLDTLSYRIRVGDMVYLKAGDRIPVDMVVLSSSSDGMCYMETAPLDGETNLKQVKAVHATHELSSMELATLSGTVECETPHHRLYSFRGNLNIRGAPEVVSLDERHLLLMGSVLKNTDWVIGLCVYAGPETKMGLNLKTPPSKFSRLDVGLNTYVFFIFALNFTLCGVCAALSAWWNTLPVAKTQHLVYDFPIALRILASFLSYFALLNYMIPLSLVITLEVARFLQAKFMGWDKNMFHDGRFCIAKTSSLNDELALVEYIFSDKTGTLTENLMTFRQCSINGVIYRDSLELPSAAVPPSSSSFASSSQRVPLLSSSRASSSASLKNGASQEGGILRALQTASTDREEQALHKFLLALAVCHSVQSERDKTTGEVTEYKAASPDEEALCKGAKNNGYVYVDRVQNSMKLQIVGKEVEYEILLEIEFTSERRRMSMVLRDEKGDIIMFTKGADSVILERLDASAPANEKYLEQTKVHLSEFSQVGLRTLLFGTKSLTTEKWEEFRARWVQAATLIEGRDETLEALSDELERGLELIGASAIEDKLQDGVPETIANLRKAGIKIWVITGDKQETAINIGYSSKLLTPQMEVLCLNSTDELELEQILMQYIKQYIKVDEDDQQILDEWKRAREDYLAQLKASVPAHHVAHPSSIQSTNSLQQPQKFKAPPPVKRKKKRRKNPNFSTDMEALIDDTDGSDTSEIGSPVHTSSLMDDNMNYDSDTLPRPSTASYGSEHAFPIHTLPRKNDSYSSYGTMDSGSPDTLSSSPPDFGDGPQARSSSMSTSSSMRSSYQASDRNMSFNQGSMRHTKNKKIAIVVDGKTLVHILLSFREVFMVLARRAQSVVCNRVTPLQKAELVKLVSQSENIVSLAIGDGGNDVSMIQQAHIGVGIQGREGNQAARASDFALPQFRHLQRLLTVHGRYCLLRNTKIIYYSIYKNTATFFPQFYYGFFNGFSAQSLYNQWVMMIFNVFLTSVPIFFLGLFEKDLHESIIERNPQVYQVHKTLKFRSLLRWFAYAIYHASVIFWFTFGLFAPTHTISQTGRSTGLPEFGFHMMTMAVLVVTLRLALESVHWVFFTHFAVWGSLIFYFFARLALSHMLHLDSGQFFVFEQSLATPTFWFSIILVVTTCLIPNFAVKFLKRSYSPKEWYLLQEREPNLSHGKAILGFMPSEPDTEDDFPDDESYHDAYMKEQDERKPLIRLQSDVMRA